MMLTVSRRRRIELWSAPKCAGGVRLAVLRDVTDCVASATVDGDSSLRLTVPLTDANIAAIVANVVIRIDGDDATFDEWRVADVVSDTGAGVAAIACEPVDVMLATQAALVSHVDGLGVRRFDFELVALTPTAIIDTYVLPALSATGMGWWTRGTIDSSAPLNLTVSWDSPLSLLKAIADAARLELQVRRNGTTGYYIELVTRIGSSAATADLRYRKNLPAVRRSASAREMATRVYPRGMAIDGYHATMARNQWRVQSVGGATVQLNDPAGGAGPLITATQLNGLHLRKVDGSTTLVTGGSTVAQSVDVASIAGIAADDLVSFVHADGSELTYLDSPADVAAYGVTVGVLDAPEVPGTENRIPNPAVREWPSTLPTGWTKIGTFALTKETSAAFVRSAGQSIKCTSAPAGEGVQSPFGRILPTTGKPYGSGFASVYVVSGKVRVELVCQTSGAVTTIFPSFPGIASSSFLGRWEELGVSGEDLNAGVQRWASIRVVAHGGPATFYVDAVQMTETASQEPFIEGSGATRLWQLANVRLATYAGPMQTFDVVLVDLAAVDGTAYPETALTLGADARITDTRLAPTFSTRIVALERDYLTPGNTKITLSTRPEDLTGILARTPRAARQPVDAGEPTGAEYPAGPRPIAPAIVATIDSLGRVSVTVTGDEATASVRLAVSKTATPSDATVRGETAAAGRIVSYPNLVTLQQGERAYLAAFAYTQAAGAGTESIKGTTDEARPATGPLEGTTTKCR